MEFKLIQAVILDWAGTTVDFGSRAPVAALQRVFEAAGVPVTPAEVREHMGLLKKDHIRSILAASRVQSAWTAAYGAAPGERDVERIFAQFLPQQLAILAEYSAPIPGVPETIARWRAAGVRIGSTTGYTRALLDVVMAPAAKAGYAPDASVTPDEVGAGRPKPFMCYRNAILLGVFPLWQCVKIGDTAADIEEGRNAGMWTVGVTATGNEIGLTQTEWESLPAGDQAAKQQKASDRLTAAGAHYTAPSVADCTELLHDIELRIAAGVKP